MLKDQSYTQIKSAVILEQIKNADTLYKQSKFTEAIEIYNNLIAKVDNSYTSDKYELYKNLGNCYYTLKDYDNAINAYENTLKFYTNNHNIYRLLGFMYYCKNIDKSIEYYLKAMEIKPRLDDFVILTQAMIKNINYSQENLKAIFEKYVDIFRPQILNGKKAFEYSETEKNPDKKLKIAYLSSDFHCHTMMQFVLPILENHNQEKFDITLYSCGKKADRTTRRIKDTGLKFVDCSKMTNEQRASLIHNDKIDILIDLSGYTHDAIWALLYKPAPIIAQYLGFLGTYGIKEVDYIIADKFTIPKNIAKYYTEKPLYIDCGMDRFTFTSKNQKFPNIPPLPYLKNKYITFGSFNAMQKINPYTVSLWSKILKAIPNSRLLIYRTQLKEYDIIRLTKQFSDNGISKERLIFNNQPMEGSHFNAYPLCDIALDTIPFSGLSTTIEQLYMGILTLALTTETLAGKGTSRINKALKLDNFIAKSEEEFILLAKNIASNPEKLNQYRNNLRDIIKNSFLCTDFKNFTECIEKQYKKVWQDFCK